MDDAMFHSLKSAYSVTPHNHALLIVLLRALLERGESQAGLEIIAGRDLSAITEPADRLTIGRLYLATGHAEEALAYAESQTPESWLVKANALAALGRNEEGRLAYERAVSANPTLEDRELLSRLVTRVRTFPAHRSEGQRLRVISNDDTSALEVSRLIESETERVTFAQVGGLDEVKQQIHRKIILPFQKPSLFQRFRKRSGGGILLYGPPGCGKTLLARATAGECNAKFYNVVIADVLDMYIGESERKLHAVFEKARQTAPSVLFFDEIEALGGKRQYSREATSAKVVSQFLAEMDGFAPSNTGVLVLGATNVPWAVDPAFRRPGRFDRVQFVPPPDRAARESILRILFEWRPVEDGIDIPYLAQHASGFSGADLRNLIETAIEEAIQQSIAAGKEVPITDRHLKAALKSVKATTLEWLTTARNHARYANDAGQYDEVLEFLAKHGKA
jgi:transitional endoplasmic reticulum ATPase